MFDPSTSTLKFVEERLAGTRDGDAQAENELFARVYERFDQQAQLMFRGKSGWERFGGHEDLVQNACAKLFAELRKEKIVDARHFFALSATVMRQELINLARQIFGPEGSGANRAAVGLGPNNSDSSSGLGVDPAAAGLDPQQLAAWREFHEKIQSLPPEHREVLDLVTIQGLTQPDAAEVTLPPSRARM